MQSDCQLIRKIVKSGMVTNRGRRAADLLIERYYREIYAYVFRQTGERELAMDLTQEIFIQILQKIDTYNEKKAGFRTWAYRIAANKITDFYRSSAYRGILLEVPFISEEEKDGDDFLKRYSTDSEVKKSGQIRSECAGEMAWESVVEEIVIQKDLIQQIMVIVAKYPVDWIRIFQQKCFEELTFLEISQEMELPVNTVKTRFYSMVKKIREEVDC